MLFIGHFEAHFFDWRCKFDCNDNDGAKENYCLCCNHDHESRFGNCCLGDAFPLRNWETLGQGSLEDVEWNQSPKCLYLRKTKKFSSSVIVFTS